MTLFKPAPSAQYRQRQRGVSFFGALIILVVLGTIGLVGLRVAPIYSNHYMGVVPSMEALAAMPEMAGQPFSRIRNTLQIKFDTNDVKYLHARDVKIKREGSKTTVIAKYEAREPFLFNMDVVGNMEKQVVLRQ